MKRLGLLLGLALTFTLHAEDKDGLVAAKRIEDGKPMSYAEKALRENVFEAAVESGVLFNIDGGSKYTALPQMQTFLWNLDEIGNEGWLRGNTVWKVSAFEMPLLDGPESHMVGSVTGPTYNFVQPGWNLVPFLGTRVGFGFTDSRDARLKGQGQDFCFVFMVIPGVRYFFSEKLSGTFEINYLHASNGGLSEPERKNDGWNLVGPQAALTYTF